MEEDLHLYGLRYNTALTVFFVPYALFEVSYRTINVTSRKISNSFLDSIQRCPEVGPSVNLDSDLVLRLGSRHDLDGSGELLRRSYRCKILSRCC
jgi:hypothetical protein